MSLSKKDFLIIAYKKIFKRFIPKKCKEVLVVLRSRLLNTFSGIGIETITACNRRCPYCPNSTYDRGLLKNCKEMEREVFYKIIDELAKRSWIGIIQPHLYGEPLLDKRLPEFLAYIKEKLPFCSVEIFTNGDFLTIDIYKQLVHLGVTDFVVTQHQKEGTSAINEILKYRDANGTDGVKFSYKKLDRITSRGGLVDINQKTFRADPCKIPSTMPIINYAGDVLPCCQDYFGRCSFGNIKNENLFDVWDKTDYKKFRNEVSKGLFKLEMCKNCTWGKNYYL